MQCQEAKTVFLMDLKTLCGGFGGKRSDVGQRHWLQWSRFGLGLAFRYPIPVMLTLIQRNASRHVPEEGAACDSPHVRICAECGR